MKRLTLLLAALLLSVTALQLYAQNPSPTTKTAYRVYGVGFYNLENLFDTIPNNPRGLDLEYTPRRKTMDWRTLLEQDLQPRPRHKCHDHKITPNGPAILGVSEIENASVLNDLVRDPQIRRWGLQVVHHDSPDRRGVDVGLLYNPRYFEVVNVTNHLLTIPGNPDFRSRDQMCVVGKLGGEPFAVVVNHWPSRLGGQKQSEHLRVAAAQLSKHIADSLWAIDPSMGVIIMGDLNDDPSDKSCREILGAKKHAKDVTDGHMFYNPWWKILDDDGIGTLAYKGAWNLFDQIILSGNMLPANRSTGLEFVRAKVNNFEFLTTKEGQRQGYPLRTFASGSYLNGYSDHYPTMVILKQAVKRTK